MSSYDDPMIRHARSSASRRADEYPGGRADDDDYDYGPSVARASVGRASVGRASVGSARVGPAAAGRATVRAAAAPPDPYARGHDRYADPSPVSPQGPSSTATGRAAVGRAFVRSSSVSGPSAAGPGGRGPRGRYPWGRGGRGGGPGGPGGNGGGNGPGGSRPRGDRDPSKAKKGRWRNVLIAGFAVFIMLTGVGVVGATYFVDSVETPSNLKLPESTTVYYSDGKTVMARLGSENRTELKFDEMNDAVKDAAVAAEDRRFWTHEGVDIIGLLRAALNNFIGKQTQGGSTITQQYARQILDMRDVTYSRKLREAVVAYKLTKEFTKEQILEFYLNTVPFGRGAYGIEAAAQAYFGKTARKTAPEKNQITVSEAAFLMANVKQPEPDPRDPIGSPGYDPKRSKNKEANAKALELSKGRWTYVIDGLVEMGKLTREEADKLEYPLDSLKDYTPTSAGLDKPTGLVVMHALSELAQTQKFQQAAGGGPTEVWNYIRNGGFRIVTTIDVRAQRAAEAAADITQSKAPAKLRGQPKNWQAALVAIEPGTGRVLAYFGGKNGAGADFAGFYIDEDGDANGFGYHPPGSTFKVYDLATALKFGYSLESYWDSGGRTKEFPEADRVKGKLGPIRNASSAACQPTCTLVQAAVASLNIPFFDLTLRLGAANVLALARDAGIDYMWSPEGGRQQLRGADIAKDMVPKHFGNELGIGQYPVTVLDHANGMATFAAGGNRAYVHFVKEVTQDGKVVYGETIRSTNIGLNEAQIRDLHNALRQVREADFGAGWNSAGKTGTWEWKPTDDKNSHVWMVGYTKAIAAAVWLGTTDGKPLIDKNGNDRVYGGTYAGPIWQQFMRDAHAAMKFDKDDPKYKFGPKAGTGDTNPPGSIPSPTPTFTPPATPPFPPGNPGGGGPGDPGGPGGPGGGGGGGGFPFPTPEPTTLTPPGNPRGRD